MFEPDLDEVVELVATHVPDKRGQDCQVCGEEWPCEVAYAADMVLARHGAFPLSERAIEEST